METRPGSEPAGRPSCRVNPDRVLRIRSPVPILCHLGNDLVDLRDPRVRRRGSEGLGPGDRFLERVLAPPERESVLAAPDPSRALWIHWAGKEAAFKTLSKLRGEPPVFHHKRFRVTVFPPSSPDSGAPETRAGEIRFHDRLFPAVFHLTPVLIHAVTWSRDPSTHDPAPWEWPENVVHRVEEEPEVENWEEELRPAFTAREWACVSHRSSALTRLAARRSLARTLGMEEARLEVTCHPGPPGRRIPRVLADGRALEVDLTLSHHGRFLAWAFVR